MITSILDSTKKILGIGVDDVSFDLDILTHINTAFAILQNLGVGPEEGFTIEDATATWADYIQDNNLAPVRTYVYLRVRLLFDPPTTSYLIQAMQEQMKELEWRLNVYEEGLKSDVRRYA